MDAELILWQDWWLALEIRDKFELRRTGGWVGGTYGSLLGRVFEEDVLEESRLVDLASRWRRR